VKEDIKIERINKMAIIIGYVIAFIGGLVAFLLSIDKPKNKKYKVWGIALMVPISPALAFAIGLTYAVSVGSGWAGLIMWYIFPFVFIVGLVMLLVGIFKKEETEIV
jgi:amino acid transporter